MTSANLVDYEQVTGTYETGLNTQLRGFRGGARFLEHWVHDPDPIKSIVNMIEAAQTDGLGDVTILLGARTVAALDTARLDELTATLGQVAKLPRDGGLSLTVRFSRAAATAHGRGAEARDRARRAREARDARLRAQAARVERHARGAGLHPVYHDVVAQLLAARLLHEGTVDTARGLQRLEAGCDGWVLSVLIDPATHTVRSAKFRGAKADAHALLEALCSIMEGKPLLECADHAGIRLEHRLRDRSSPRPVAGIVTPESAEPALVPLIAAVRELLALYRRRTGYDVTENRFEPDPGPTWAAVPPEQRVARLQSALDDVMSHHGLRPGDVVCTRIDRGTRATVEIRAELPAQRKALLLMAVERGLKDAVEPTLHLYQEEMHDKNKIRRL